MKASNLEGLRFGRLVAVDRAENKGTGTAAKAQWLCSCDCGGSCIAQAGALKSGNTQSCGCLKREASMRNASLLNRKHGKTGSRAHTTWMSMLQRCNDHSHRSFKDYGGRGIKVCERWLEFANFYADMGDPPDGHSIERNRVNEGYSPENCQWIPSSKQAHNRRDSFLIKAFGEELPPAAWARKTGLSKAAILYRKASGMSDEAAVSTPPRKNGSKRRGFSPPGAG